MNNIAVLGVGERVIIGVAAVVARLMASLSGGSRKTVVVVGDDVSFWSTLKSSGEAQGLVVGDVTDVGVSVKGWNVITCFSREYLTAESVRGWSNTTGVVVVNLSGEPLNFHVDGYVITGLKVMKDEHAEYGGKWRDFMMQTDLVYHAVGMYHEEGVGRCLKLTVVRRRTAFCGETEQIAIG